MLDEKNFKRAICRFFRIEEENKILCGIKKKTNIACRLALCIGFLYKILH